MHGLIIFVGGKSEDLKAAVTALEMYLTFLSLSHAALLVIWILASYRTTNQEEINLHFAGIIIVPASIGLVYLALKLYDEPIRKLLIIDVNNNHPAF